MIKLPQEGHRPPAARAPPGTDAPTLAELVRAKNALIQTAALVHPSTPLEALAPHLVPSDALFSHVLQHPALPASLLEELAAGPELLADNVALGGTSNRGSSPTRTRARPPRAALRRGAQGSISPGGGVEEGAHRSSALARHNARARRSGSHDGLVDRGDAREEPLGVFRCAHGARRAVGGRRAARGGGAARFASRGPREALPWVNVPTRARRSPGT